MEEYYERIIYCCTNCCTTAFEAVYWIQEKIMRVVNFSEARSHLKLVLDQVSEDADYTIISRRNADDAVVMS